MTKHFQLIYLQVFFFLKITWSVSQKTFLFTQTLQSVNELERHIEILFEQRLRDCPWILGASWLTT